MSKERTGSRYLYEPFQAETSARMETIEKVAEERWRGLERRLRHIEAALIRLERRLWLAVYGVAAAIISQGFVTLLELRP